MSEPTSRTSSRWLDLAVFTVVGTALTLFFWWPLAVGYGIIGGDTYTYFFPQKTYFADWLKQGVLPLWNNLVGFGYPLVGESQTGVFYPFHLLFYWLMDVNSAYNANHLLHTVIAFIGMGFLGRENGLSKSGAVLAACVFVFGWFPARSCLEWAIITGGWIPWQLWSLQRAIQQKQPAYYIALAGVTGLQLLAGHYNLAFISVLACVGMAVWGLSSATIDEDTDDAQAVSRWSAMTWTSMTLLLGFSLAAVQLIPTMELKSQSQRSTVEKFGEVGQGHLPPWYLVQTVAPFIYYDAMVDSDVLLGQPTFLTYPKSTNKVEAHLYFGLLPLAMALGGIIALLWNHDLSPNERWRMWYWLVLGLACLVYATGWLVPIAQYLPGFSFFRGPGRYTVMTTITVALFAGWFLDRVTKRFDTQAGRVVIGLVLAISIFDLYVMGRNTLWMSGADVSFFNGNGTGYTLLVANPGINQRNESPVEEIVSQSNGLTRIFSPGPNLATSTGLSATPVYLGIGPEQYYDDQLTMPAPPEDQRSQQGKLVTMPSQVTWLQKSSVTHVLSFEPLDATQWPVEAAVAVADPYFGRAWGRQEPVYLSKLAGVRPRISWRDELQENDQGATTIELMKYQPNRVEVETFISQPNQLILTDLAWPGWVSMIDGQAVSTETIEGQFRGVNVPRGKHVVTMMYRPWSLWVGGVISCLALATIIFAVIAVRRRDFSRSPNRASSRIPVEY